MSDVETNIDCYPRDSSNGALLNYSTGPITIGTSWAQHSVILNLPAKSYSKLTIRSNSGTSGGSSTASVSIRNVELRVNKVASRLGNTTAVGSATQPVYFNQNGQPEACSYTLEKSVPANAVFSDTTYVAATTSAAGLMSAADKQKLDGIATGATANTGDITGVTAGNGLTGGGTSGSVSLAVGAGTGITVAADTVSAKLRSTTALSVDSAAATTTSGRVYPVAVDKTGYLAVNVPWTDNDTTYSEATTSAAGLMSASDKSKLNNIASGANAYTLPAAGSSLGGVKTGGDVSIADGVITVLNVSNNSGNATVSAKNSIYLNRGASQELIIKNGTTTQAKFDSYGNFIPGANNVYDLGSSTNGWNSIYANNIESTNASGLQIKSGSTLNVIRKASTSLIFQFDNNVEHARFDPSGSLLPGADITYDLGYSDKRWRNVNAQQFKGDLVGNASTASAVAWSGITNKPAYFEALAATGTEIPSGADLNSIDYIKVGHYRSNWEGGAVLQNSPTDKRFTMEVTNPMNASVDNETTDTWVYRLRTLTTYQGKVYKQVVYSDDTAGHFIYDVWQQDLIVYDSTVGDSLYPIYLENGEFKVGGLYANGTCVILNNEWKNSQAVNIYAATTGGTAGQILKATGATSAPTWVNLTTEDTTSTNCPVVTKNSSGNLVYHPSVYVNHSSGVLMGAAWNDYAEYRATKEEIEPGRVIIENGDDTLSLSTTRLQPGAHIVSDTYGMAIGQMQGANTPIAISGRVLAYPYEDRKEFRPGDAVCAGPNGTVSKMSRDEIMMCPERIIGTVSCVPTYETWGDSNTPVNGRIWISVR